VNSKDVTHMAGLLFLLALLLIAGLAPTFGRDSSDSRSEAAHDDRGWWPAGPDAHPHAHY
jgi:hypothetical protein